jgi:hypothetical protein
MTDGYDETDLEKTIGMTTQGKNEKNYYYCCPGDNH